MPLGKCRAANGESDSKLANNIKIKENSTPSVRFFGGIQFGFEK
jgi:hypothetical protein